VSQSTERLRLEETWQSPALVTLLKGGSTRAGCLGPHSVRFWVSPHMGPGYPRSLC